ncbi:MAG: hypothetical protein B6I28_00090 [Fusobacteriia bacterium 4572_132]|nr:MAG: hypothetical protein B6I28_00090 [Fusobacteriia bacterium 4572_132]
MKEKLYLVDFDGTITKKDTLNYISNKFYLKEMDIWKEKKRNGTFKVKDWLILFEKIFKTPKEKYDEILDILEIDESFIEFSKNNEIRIVSGGFVYNIKRILSRYNLDKIKIYGNELKFLENNRIKITMGNYNEECGKCGVCKTNILKEYKKEYKKIVFIGDGVTDVCVAQYSDLVYAKKGSYLEKQLLSKKVNCIPFEKFSEITD